MYPFNYLFSYLYHQFRVVYISYLRDMENKLKYFDRIANGIFFSIFSELPKRKSHPERERRPHAGEGDGQRREQHDEVQNRCREREYQCRG